MTDTCYDVHCTLVVRIMQKAFIFLICYAFHHLLIRFTSLVFGMLHYCGNNCDM